MKGEGKGRRQCRWVCESPQGRMVIQKSGRGISSRQEGGKQAGGAHRSRAEGGPCPAPGIHRERTDWGSKVCVSVCGMSVA